MGKLKQCIYDGLTLRVGDRVRIRLTGELSLWTKRKTISELWSTPDSLRVYYREGGWDYVETIAKYWKEGGTQIFPIKPPEPEADNMKTKSNFPMLVQDVNTGKYMVLTTSNGLLCDSTVKIIETSIAII
jgi:hypothetical protein